MEVTEMLQSFLKSVREEVSEIDRRVRVLEVSVCRTDERLAHLISICQDFKGDLQSFKIVLEEFAAQPGQRWNTMKGVFIASAITSVVGGIVGVLIYRVASKL